MPSETSELMGSKAFPNGSHFLTEPLEKPVIGSLGFPEFGNFHSGRFFMTSPFVQAVIRGLALLEQQANSPTRARISFRMELESCTLCTLMSTAVSHSDVESSAFTKATKPGILPGIKVYCLSTKYWDFFRGRFFGGILKMLMLLKVSKEDSKISIILWLCYQVCIWWKSVAGYTEKSSSCTEGKWYF